MSNQELNNKQDKPYKIGRNDQGFVLVTSMLIMVLLTILGIAATNTSIFELQIAANDRDYKRNFYKAEGASFEAAQELENETDKEELLPGTTTKTWLKSVNDSNYIDPVAGLEPGKLVDDDGIAASLDDAASEVSYATFSRGVVKGAKGASLSMTGTTVREFSVYGRSIERNGSVTIEVGYKKRF